MFDHEVIGFPNELPSGILARDGNVGGFLGAKEEDLMSEIGVRGIDLFKIAGERISGWIPSWKTGDIRPTATVL